MTTGDLLEALTILQRYTGAGMPVDWVKTRGDDEKDTQIAITIPLNKKKKIPMREHRKLHRLGGSTRSDLNEWRYYFIL